MPLTRAVLSRTTVALATVVALLLGTIAVVLAAPSSAGAAPDSTAPDGVERRYALGIDPALAADATLRGTVLGPQGELRDNVLVEAFSALDPLGDPVASALTYELADVAAHGAYELHLPAGDYLVRFSSPDGARTVLEPAYYGGGAGTAITLAAEQTRLLEAVTLQADRGVPVTGRVVGVGDQPRSGIRVSLIRIHADGDLAQTAQVWTAADGTFRFPVVHRGRTFTVYAYGGYDIDDVRLGLPNTWLGDAPSQQTASRFTIGSRSTGEAVGDLHHVPGTLVTGHAASVDGAVEGDLALIHLSDDGTGGSVISSGWVEAGRDTLRFTAHPGRYTLGLLTYDQYGDPESWLFLGNTPQLDQATVITVGTTALDAGTVVVGANTARITFQVIDHEGQPAVDLWNRPVVVNRANRIIGRATSSDAEDGWFHGRVPWGVDFTLAVYDDWDEEWVYLGGARSVAQARFLRAESGTASLDVGYLSMASPAPTAPAPLLAGKARNGQVVAVNPPAWSIPDVDSTHQWLRDGEAIPGATGSSYLLQTADVGHRISARVTGRAYWHTPGTVVSTSMLVGPGEAPAAIQPPRVSGTAAPGGTVTATPGVWDTDGVTTSLRWYADGRPIPGATGPRLALGWQHAGARLTVVETATRPGFLPGSSTSPASRIARATSQVRVGPVKNGRGLRVRVLAPGNLPVVGTLALYDGNRTISKVDLVRGHRGVYTFDLTRLKRGKHRLSGWFGGNAALTVDRSAAVTVRVP